MSFIERASVFCAIAFWYLTVRGLLLRWMTAELKGRPADTFDKVSASALGIPVTLLSLMCGFGLYHALRWVLTGETFP